MSRLDVVDIDVDPLAERVRRRRTLVRIGLPLCGVGLIVGFLLGIAIYAERANREGVLGLSDTLLQSLRDRIALQVSAYLEPATHAVLLAHSMLGRGGATGRAEEAFSFAASVLGQTPQITNVLFADSAGDFMLVTRAPGGRGGTETKRITMRPARAVSWTTRDAAGQVTGRREEAADTYDARTRGWFVGARNSDDVFWTSPYIFFTERAPGVTAAVHGPDADPDVVGVDIRLDALSGFLRGLVIGRTGKAYLVARNGDVVAGPDAGRVLLMRDGLLRPAAVSEVGDPALTASWDHFRVAGVGTRVIEAGGERLISIVTPLSGRAQAGGDVGSGGPRRGRIGCWRSRCRRRISAGSCWRIRGGRGCCPWSWWRWRPGWGCCWCGKGCGRTGRTGRWRNGRRRCGCRGRRSRGWRGRRGMWVRMGRCRPGSRRSWRGQRGHGGRAFGSLRGGGRACDAATASRLGRAGMSTGWSCRGRRCRRWWMRWARARSWRWRMRGGTGGRRRCMGC